MFAQASVWPQGGVYTLPGLTPWQADNLQQADTLQQADIPQ